MWELIIRGNIVTVVKIQIIKVKYKYNQFYVTYVAMSHMRMSKYDIIILRIPQIILMILHRKLSFS